MVPIGEVRRWKCMKGGMKFYRSELCLFHRNRVLRHTSRTAEGAMRYGQRVLERYLHWCDISLSKESALQIADHHTN
jgi:hypothetical protein